MTLFREGEVLEKFHGVEDEHLVSFVE